MSSLKSFSFKKLLDNKKFSIAFSVIVAFVAWVVITIDQKPTMERSFSDMTVAINLEDTFASENNMSIIGDISEQRFTVVVRGSNQVVSSLSPKEVNLYASAAEVDSPGEYKLTVAANTNSEYEILTISPKTINVNFDYIEKREFNILASAAKVNAVKGLVAETAMVSGTENNTITIEGPRTIVNSIEVVNAKVDVEKTLSASETFDADIVLLDINGKKVDDTNLTLSTNQVKVTVPISKQKKVPVKVDFSNTPAGFKNNTLKCKIDHSEVVIIGTPETVDKISEITLSPIDITKISKKSKSFDVAPKLPEGVRLLDSIEHFVVKVDLSDYEEAVINVPRIKFSGLSKGLTTDKNEGLKNVKICGPKSAIKKLKEMDSYALANLKDKKVGAHTISVTFGFDGFKNIWVVGDYTTTVTIK